MTKACEVLAAALRAEKPSPPTLGSFSATTERIATAKEAIDRFLAFGGTGWLCHTGSAAVVRIGPGTAEGIPAGAWPECGELVKEKQSLHLSSDGAGGWILTTYVSDSTGDGLLVRHTLLARDRDDALAYEVYWKRMAMTGGGPESYRSALSRFIGFAPVEKEA